MTSNEGLLVLFWYQWKEETHISSSTKIIRIGGYSENLGRGGNHPPSVDVLQKMAPVDEG